MHKNGAPNLYYFIQYRTLQNISLLQFVFRIVFCFPVSSHWYLEKIKVLSLGIGYIPKPTTRPNNYKFEAPKPKPRPNTYTS